MINDTMIPSPESPTWVEHLYHHVTQHVQAEQGLLEDYVTAAQATNSEALAYLVNVIVEDEKRHHKMFSEFAAALKHGLEWRNSGTEIPSIDFQKVDSKLMEDVVEKLLDNEERDARELRRLHKMVRDSKDTTLWELIVEIMQRDTEKHIAILRFVRRHLK